MGHQHATAGSRMQAFDALAGRSGCLYPRDLGLLLQQLLPDATLAEAGYFTVGGLAQPHWGCQSCQGLVA